MDARDSRFVGWEASFGGAVFVGAQSEFAVGFTTFFGNVAQASGGAVVVLQGHFECSSCEFKPNLAKGSGGALALLSQSHGELDDAVLDSNSAGTYGGAVFADEHSRLRLTGAGQFGRGDNGGAEENRPWLDGNYITPEHSRPDLSEQWGEEAIREPRTLPPSQRERLEMARRAAAEPYTEPPPPATVRRNASAVWKRQRLVAV